MRQESDRDRANQKKAAQWIEREWELEVKDNAGGYDRIDYEIHKGTNLVEFGEYKWRGKYSRSHPDMKEGVMLSCQKWFCLRIASLDLKMPGFFFVQFSEGLYYIPALEMRCPPCTVEFGGRTVNTRPGMPNEVESIIKIPSDQFRPVLKGRCPLIRQGGRCAKRE